MSNYIYNDNFNNGDKEPIHFDFGPSPKRGSSKTFIFVLVCCIVLSIILCLLVGVSLSERHSPYNDADTPASNTVYTNNIFKSPETSAIAGANGELTRADIIAAIKDSVVEIRTQAVVSQHQYIQKGAGSGVIVGNYKSEDGSEQGYYIITNAHVIEDAISTNRSQITVILTSGTEYNASVVGSDSKSDIAVLKIKETKELTCATFANEEYKLRVGDEVIAIGNPLGQLGGTVTNGYISALDREILVDGNKMNLLQTDAPINPGNSGGGLFNLRGELVGIINAKSTGTDIEGIGFAIPSNDALKVYSDMVNYGYVTGRGTKQAPTK